MIERHRTAISRYNLSKPLQILNRYGYLNGSYDFFDYGCGKGDDLRCLIDSGVKAEGWDPFYSPENTLVKSDLVNLGFVINVIEDIEERKQTLIKAYALTKKILIISVMLEHQYQTGDSYLDGVLTSNNTFQKYYTQEEFIRFVEQTLKCVATPLGSGVLFIFKDKEEEVNFLNLKGRYVPSQVSLSTFEKKREEQVKPVSEKRYQAHYSLLEALWGRWLTLGRKPKADEVAFLDEVEQSFNSLSYALNFLQKFKSHDEIERARSSRYENLLVMFAMGLFRGNIKTLLSSPTLSRDIRYFFGKQSDAERKAKEKLFEIGNTDILFKAIKNAEQLGLGKLDNDCFYVVREWSDTLPVPLRIYLECSTHLIGSLDDYDLIKIHYISKKITLFRFNDFSSPIPFLEERAKVDFVSNRLRVYKYPFGDFKQHAFFGKSSIIPPQSTKFEDALKTDTLIEKMFNIEDQYTSSEVTSVLKSYLFEMKNQVSIFNRVEKRPLRHEKCGRYFLYEHLLETSYSPRSLGTYYVISDLALHILDPICDYYGEIIIKNKIKKNHAIVSFLIEYEENVDVALWIAEEITFDLLVLDLEFDYITIGYCETPRGIIKLKEQGSSKKITKEDLEKLQKTL